MTMSHSFDHQSMSMSGGVDPLLPLLDPGRPFFPPLRPFSLLPPAEELLVLADEPGLELVERTDSAGEDDLDSWASDSLKAAVSPSVKLSMSTWASSSGNDGPSHLSHKQ